MQIIRKNFGLKLLALTLAIVGWAYFRYAQNPILATARFDQQLSVPIVAVNLPVGYVAHFSEKQAMVTVESKPGSAPIKPDEIRAVLDLSGMGTGVFNVGVRLVAPEITVQSLSPASETLTIERVVQRNFPVVVHYVGLHGVVVTKTQLRPSAVTVNGPQSSLAQVAEVHVDVPMANSPKSFDEMIRPIAVDSTGVEVAGLAVDPDLVRVRMEFAPGTGSPGGR